MSCRINDVIISLKAGSALKSVLSSERKIIIYIITNSREFSSQVFTDQ